MNSKDSSRPHPALNALFCARWADAFAWLHHLSEETLGQARAQRLLDVWGDRNAVQDEIRETADALYALGTPAAGELALAWSMLTCRPSCPASFRSVLPQLQYALDAADLDANNDGDTRDRLRIWWAAGAGDYVKEKRSMFAVAVAVLAGKIMKESSLAPVPSFDPVDVAKWSRTAPDGPTLTVMPAAKATKLNAHNKQFQEILDKPLPLVVASGLTDAQRHLSYEFPHASAALNVLFKDLREGAPIRIRPTILVGTPGCGKSRLVRRIANAIGLQHIHRVDGSASGSDSHFAGISKSWASTEPSVPARAVLASRTGNPLVMVDELCKGSPRGGLGGTLWEALASFTETSETGSCVRDPSLDAELNLSMVSYLCTANDVTVLPDYLKDRFRIMRVPAPTLADLPLLAGSVVDQMLLEGDEWAGSVAPFAPDELRVMGKAWRAGGFSIRKLQKIVRATIETRDACQMRH